MQPLKHDCLISMAGEIIPVKKSKLCDKSYYFENLFEGSFQKLPTCEEKEDFLWFPLIPIYEPFSENLEVVKKIFHVCMIENVKTSDENDDCYDEKLKLKDDLTNNDDVENQIMILFKEQKVDDAIVFLEIISAMCWKNENFIFDLSDSFVLSTSLSSVFPSVTIKKVLKKCPQFLAFLRPGNTKINFLKNAIKNRSIHFEDMHIDRTTFNDIRDDFLLPLSSANANDMLFNYRSQIEDQCLSLLEKIIDVDVLNDKKVFVAGGFISSVLCQRCALDEQYRGTQWSSNDIDIWIHANSNSADRAVEVLCRIIKGIKCPFEMSPSCSKLNIKLNIDQNLQAIIPTNMQIIMSNFSIRKLIPMFEIDLCKSSFYMGKIFVTNKLLECWPTMTQKVRHKRFMSDRGISYVRHRKYMSRGMCFVDADNENIIIDDENKMHYMFNSQADYSHVKTKKRKKVESYDTVMCIDTRQADVIFLLALCKLASPLSTKELK